MVCAVPSGLVTPLRGWLVFRPSASPTQSDNRQAGISLYLLCSENKGRKLRVNGAGNWQKQRANVSPYIPAHRLLEGIADRGVALATGESCSGVYAALGFPPLLSCEWEGCGALSLSDGEGCGRPPWGRASDACSSSLLSSSTRERSFSPSASWLTAWQSSSMGFERGISRNPESRKIVP